MAIARAQALKSRATPKEQRMIEDFRRWESSLPAESRSLHRDEARGDTKIVALRRG